MTTNIDTILQEIEQIIAKIGNYDIGKLQLSEQGRKELTDLFYKKVFFAKALQLRKNKTGS